MKKFLGKRGFALITVFIISTLLFGIIGFTFVSVNRQLSIKNLNTNSKKAFTVADAGLEQMINRVYNYPFLTLPEYLAQNDNEIPLLFQIGEGGIYDESFFDQKMDEFGCSNDCKTLIKNLLVYYYNENYNPDINNFTEFLNLFRNYYLYNSIYYPNRTKYFYNYDYIKYENEKMEIYINDEVVNCNHPDYNELLNIALTDRVKILLDILIPTGINLTSGNEYCSICLKEFLDLLKNIRYEIIDDIEDAYDKWEKEYLLGNDYDIDLTKSDYYLGELEKMVIELGGESSSDQSSTSNLILEKVLFSYDIDYPKTNAEYEGVIVRSADWLKIGEDTDNDNEPNIYLYKLIISAISYVFNKPIPDEIYSNIEQIIFNNIKREKDKEYKIEDFDYLSHNLYISILDIDNINQNIKNYGYQILPIRRAIRGELNVPQIHDINYPLLGCKEAIFFSNYSFDYVIAVNDDLQIGENETIYGPLRSNGNILFDGITFDRLLSLIGSTVTHHGKYIFYNESNDKWYIVDLNQTSTNPNPPYSLWDGSINVYAYTEIKKNLNSSNSDVALLKILNKTGTYKKIINNEEVDVGFINYYLDVNDNGDFDQNIDQIIVTYIDPIDILPLEDKDIIYNTGDQILTKVNGTQYYINGGGQKVELEFFAGGSSKGGKIKVTIGSNSYFIDMPNNYPQTVIVDEEPETIPGGVIYIDGDVEIKGTVNGLVTIYATGDVHIRSNIDYASNPVTDPNDSLPSPENIDLLGVVTPKKLIVDDNANNALKIYLCVLAGDGFVTDKDNPNKIREFIGSIIFATDTYEEQYRKEWLHFNRNLTVIRPPLFGTTNIISLPLEEEVLIGNISDIKFGRILWREMVNPP